jgi:hypothetical protein
MKTPLLIALFLIYIFSSAQKPVIGVDLGFQAGQEQYFETGLNAAWHLKDGLMGEIAIGIEDDINRNLIGYRFGLSIYDAYAISSTFPDAKPLPLIGGLNYISYQIEEKSISSFRPEIGIRGIWRHGRGRSIVKLLYGYNFIDKRYQNRLNTHLFRISINTNWKSFIDTFTFYWL